MIEYGLLRCHSDNSINDSVMTVQALVQRARQLGAQAVALTDTGNMIGTWPCDCDFCWYFRSFG